MKQAIRIATTALLLLGGVALTPGAASAAGFRGGSVVDFGRGINRPSIGRRFHQRPSFRSGAPFAPFGAPVIVYAPPLMDSGVAPTYETPPPTYAPPPAPAPLAVAPAPPAPPMASVVQYPHGRYELRGDGTTAPYVWVWIPNPPPAPPAAAPSSPLASGPPLPERHSQVYRWTDAQGVKHFTDRADAIPAQYRAQADQL